MTTCEQWIGVLKSFLLLIIGALGGIVFGVDVWIQTWTPDDFDTDWYNPPWPFTHVRWNIAVGGLTVSVLSTLLIFEYFRRKRVPMIVSEIFWLVALSVVWIICTIINVHQDKLYAIYCQDIPGFYYQSDVCDNMYKPSLRIKTLDIVTTIVICIYTAFVIVMYLVMYLRPKEQQPVVTTIQTPRAEDMKV